jgi:iron complex transport system substrate-binding protein
MLCRALLLLSLLPALAARAEISVVDSSGRQVTLDKPAERIVALAPHIVENVFSAGAGDKLVGVVSYSNYPEQARDILQVGSAYAWSLEQLISLQPDLVVLWGSGNGISSLPRLTGLGLAVYVSEPRKLPDISDSIRDIGILAGSGITAAAVADQFDREIARLSNTYASRKPVSVFYQIWNSPLQTINGEHMISQVMGLCGADNVFAELPQLAPQISVEAVLQRDPQAIIASGMGEYRPEWLDSWKKYPALTAVETGALLHIHPDLIQRPTARISEGAQAMCEQIAGVREGH